MVNPTRKLEGLIRILLVDDDPRLLEVTKDLIERFGYVVTPSSSSSEAAALISDHHDVFDVVITDYSMPGLDGIELAMSAKKFSADIPVILFTGGNDFIDSERIKQAGIAGTISKPCGINELDATIKRAIYEKAEKCL